MKPIKKLFILPSLVLAAVFAFSALAGTGCARSGSAKATPGAGRKAKKQMEEYLKNPETFPFSFTYDGRDVKGFGKDEFEKKSETSKEEAGGTRTETVFVHKASGAEFRVDAKTYAKFDALEWTVYITNNTQETTGVFAKINACDAEFKGRKPLLKGINGDLGDMYAPYSIDLSTMPVVRNSASGRPTHGNFPYFNLEYGGGGTFVAIGWPGCWRAEFICTEKNTVSFRAGQNEIETCLRPGETVRTPLIAFLRYNGRDEQENMNLWRRWFIDCNMHRDTRGQVIPPVSGWGSVVQGYTTDMLLRTYESYKANGVKLDYMWLDAGWYVNSNGGTCSWPETGMWKVNESMFPDKFADVTKILHENGSKAMLWFEPEVVRLNKKAFLKANPEFKEEWMLGTAAAGSWLEGQLLDLGNPELREWLENRVFTVIDEGGIDMYRQDFNVDPAPVWAYCDYDGKGVARTGITENKYVQGYLRFWDDILERYPDMTIDSCASGGGRNDLETLRRAVPLHESDFWDGNPDGYIERQAVLTSLPAWFPYFKLEIHSGEEISEYHLRACLAPWTNFNVSAFSKDTNWANVRKVKGEKDRIGDLYYKDFYRLTEFSKAGDAWRAFEYCETDGSRAAVVCFRGPDSGENTQTLKLRGLNALAAYDVKDCDGRINMTAFGWELMAGLKVSLPEAATSAMIFVDRK